jgi:hypothetical protein
VDAGRAVDLAGIKNLWGIFGESSEQGCSQAGGRVVGPGAPMAVGYGGVL